MFIREFAFCEEAFIGKGEWVDLPEFRDTTITSAVYRVAGGTHSEVHLNDWQSNFLSFYLTRPCQSIFCCLVYCRNLFLCQGDNLKTGLHVELASGDFLRQGQYI